MNQDSNFKVISTLYWKECCNRKEQFTVESWANNAADNDISYMLNQLAKVFMLKRGIISGDKDSWDIAINYLAKFTNSH